MKASMFLKVLYAGVVFLLCNYSIPAQVQGVGIGTTNPQEKLHVAGFVRSDSLLGNNRRVIQADSAGTMREVRQGNNGDYLRQRAGGPIWEPEQRHNGQFPGNDCPPYPCPTQWSPTSDSTMHLGDCRRYCDTLTYGGLTDWRTPSLDEAIYLFPIAIPTPDRVWTTTFELTTYNRIVSIRFNDSDAGTVTSAASLLGCKCIR